MTQSVFQRVWAGDVGVPYSVCDRSYLRVQSFSHFLYLYLKQENNFNCMNDCTRKIALYRMCVDTLLCRYIASVLLAFTLCALCQRVPCARADQHYVPLHPLYCTHVHSNLLIMHYTQIYFVSCVREL